MGPTELSFPRIIFLSRNDQRRRAPPELVREKKKQDKKTMFQLHCCFYYYCIAQGVPNRIFSAPTFGSKSVEYIILGICKTTCHLLYLGQVRDFCWTPCTMYCTTTTTAIKYNLSKMTWHNTTRFSLPTHSVEISGFFYHPYFM